MIDLLLGLSVLALLLGVWRRVHQQPAWRPPSPPRPGERWHPRHRPTDPWDSPAVTILLVRRGLVWYRPGDALHGGLEYRTVPAFCQLYHRAE